MTKKTNNKIDKWPMSTGAWIATFIALGIPIVGQLLMIIWAFSTEQNQSVITFCRAMLIIFSILIAIMIVIVIIIGIFYPMGGLKGFFADYLFFLALPFFN